MNLPNKLTCLRMALVPLFVFAFFYSFPYHEIVALTLFIVASITDFVDGNYARSHNLVTDFGKFMDPLADKILMMSAFICLVQVQYIPAWVVIIILAREFAITGLRTLAANKGVVMAAGVWGKFKTMTQMAAVIILMLAMVPNIANPYDISKIFILGQIVLYISLVLTIFSGVDYYMTNRDKLSMSC